MNLFDLIQKNRFAYTPFVIPSISPRQIRHGVAADIAERIALLGEYAEIAVRGNDIHAAGVGGVGVKPKVIIIKAQRVKIHRRKIEILHRVAESRDRGLGIEKHLGVKFVLVEIHPLALILGKVESVLKPVGKMLARFHVILGEIIVFKADEHQHIQHRNNARHGARRNERDIINPKRDEHDKRNEKHIELRGVAFYENEQRQTYQKLHDKKQRRAVFMRLARAGEGFCKIDYPQKRKGERSIVE